MRLHVYPNEEPRIPLNFVEDTIVLGPVRAVIEEDGSKREAALYAFVVGQHHRGEGGEEWYTNADIDLVVCDANADCYSLRDFKDITVHLTPLMVKTR